MRRVLPQGTRLFDVQTYQPYVQRVSCIDPVIVTEHSQPVYKPFTVVTESCIKYDRSYLYFVDSFKHDFPASRETRHLYFTYDELI